MWERKDYDVGEEVRVKDESTLEIFAPVTLRNQNDGKIRFD
jgi:hypothetical protein